MPRFASAALAVFVVLAPASAAGPYDDLLPYIPSHCNTLVLLNVKAAYDSPLAKNEKWSDNIYQRYKSGLGFVPPDAKAVVISSQMNMTNMTRDHQFGLVRVSSLPSTKALAEREGGTTDTIADNGVVFSPRNMYVTTVGAPAVALVYPADRQAMSRWLKHAKGAKGHVDMAPYLKKAADNAGDNVLTIALDLADSADPTLLKMGLAVSPIVVTQKVADVDRLARFIASVQGLTFSAKVDESITGSVTIDFGYEIAIHKKTVHDLFLELLADQGVAVPGIEEWKSEYGATSMTLSGPLTSADLRRIFSLFQFPGLGSEEQKAGGEPNAASTQRYLKAVDAILGDLGGKKDSPDYVKTATWREKAAGQIEGLSRNGVDPIATEAAFGVSKRIRAIADTIRGVPVDVKAIESKAYYHSSPNWSVGVGWWGRPSVIWNPNGGNVSTNHQQIQEERAKVIAEGESKRLQLSSQINDLLTDAKKKLADKYKAPF